MASAFIGILALMDAEALAGFVMPARVSAFSIKNNKNVLNADALAGIAKPARASASIILNILMNVEAMSGFVPKGHRAFWQLLPNIQQPKISLGF